MRWLFYQAVLGSWPGSVDEDFRSRISDFMIKAARENKLRTSWVKPDAAYEGDLAAFAKGALSHEPFIEAFAASAANYIRIGERKSLVQLALKLTAPGIPDIYQGTEFSDLSLVDPDNRRSVDFAARQNAMANARMKPASFDEQKMALLRFGLELRKDYPGLFSGTYRPIQPPSKYSERVIAFSREWEGYFLLVAADLSGGAVAAHDERSGAWDVPDSRQRLIRTFPSSGRDLSSATAEIGDLLGSFGIWIGLYGYES